MSATNRGCERKAYDFYATPPETIRAFLANFDGISSGDRILEPSAGNGQIVKVLREGGYDNRIDAVELRPEERGALEALADNVTIGSFFDYEPDCGYDVIIGNPPYSLALDFINKSLELLHPGGLLIFLLHFNSRPRTGGDSKNVQIGLVNFIHLCCILFSQNGKRAVHF